MRTGLLMSVLLATILVMASASAQAAGNSGCSGTIQGGGDQTSCNAYGLCKAYFAGSSTGQTNKHKAGPFQDLENAACSGSQSCDSGCPCFDGSCEDVATCVAAFCPDTNPGGHGGNPSNGSPGRQK